MKDATISREKDVAKNNINEEIKARKVMLIDADGENRGVMNTKDALDEARQQNLDLVEMSSTPKQTVCRIMDYGKYLFEQSKRRKQSMKDSKAKKQETKEIRLRPAIGENDLQIKAKQARKFLDSGKMVKLDVRLRGRERRHPELAKEVIDRFSIILNDISVLEEKGSSYILVPKKGN